jgi:hypothetical protein
MCLFFSKQFLQTEKTALLYQNGFIRTQLIKIRDKFGRVIERNAINEFIFEFEMVSPMPITRLMLLEIINCETLEYNSHWTSRFEIYPKE